MGGAVGKSSLPHVCSSATLVVRPTEGQAAVISPVTRVSAEESGEGRRASPPPPSSQRLQSELSGVPSCGLDDATQQRSCATITAAAQSSNPRTSRSSTTTDDSTSFSPKPLQPQLQPQQQQQQQQRHFVRRPPPHSPSTSSMRQTLLPSLADSQRRPSSASATTAPPAGIAAPASQPSLGSSCSAFSLYSAESSIRELPPLPPQLQRMELLMKSSTGGGGGAGTAAAAAAAAAPLPAAPAVAGVAAPQLTQTFTPSPAFADTVAAASASPKLESTGEGAPARRLSATAAKPSNAFPVVRAPINVADRSPSPQRRSLSTVPSPPTTAATSRRTSGTTKTDFGASLASGAAPSLSHALLDMSFDSRALASSAATASSEIQRMGKKLHQRVGDSGLCGPSNSTLDPLISSELTSSAALSPTRTRLSVSNTYPPPHPFSASSSTATNPEHALATSPFYTETMKFVQMIQDMQRTRDAERVGYTWFRAEAIHSSGNNIQSVRSGDDLVAMGKEPPGMLSSSGDNAQSSSSEPGRDGEEEESTGGRTPVRRRDRLLSLIHWSPFESHESETMPQVVPTSTCFCGYQAVSLNMDGVTPRCTEHTDCTAHAAEHEGGSARELPFLHHAHTSSQTTFSDGETPPLPSVSASSCKQHNGEAERQLPAVMANAAPYHVDALGAPLSSSIATNSTTSLPAAESLSFCPVHVAYHPPSIFIVHKWERSTSTMESSLSAKRSHSMPGQVDVPATASLSVQPPATPLSVAIPDNRGRESNGEVSVNGKARRPIINVDVPHRRQLAKKALEDNSLFFEALSRRHIAPQ